MSAKDIILRPIPAADARRVVEREHYSGKVVQNSQLHIGVFYGGQLEGAMQFGPSLDKRKVAGLVRDSGWHQFTELNRMAFSDRLPRNSESRALGVAMRLIAKHAPQVKWVVSFADGAQCGDGTIYRASGFVLTGIKENDQIIEFPDGLRETRLVLTDSRRPRRCELAKRYGVKIGGECSLQPFIAIGAKAVPGYQFRYVRFIDPDWRDRLTVPIIPFDKIPAECRMYMGVATMCGSSKEIPGDQSGIGGASPTLPLPLAPVIPSGLAGLAAREAR
jgi:hypothetical protein